MTVGQAKVVLQFRPCFGDYNQIQARDILRLATYFQERTPETERYLSHMTREDLTRAIVAMGANPLEILSHWSEVAE